MQDLGGGKGLALGAQWAFPARVLFACHGQVVVVGDGLGPGSAVSDIAVLTPAASAGKCSEGRFAL